MLRLHELQDGLFAFGNSDGPLAAILLQEHCRKADRFADRTFGRLPAV
jgi:hypothetical protein